MEYGNQSALSQKNKTWALARFDQVFERNGVPVLDLYFRDFSGFSKEEGARLVGKVWLHVLYIKETAGNVIVRGEYMYERTEIEKVTELYVTMKEIFGEILE